jgi:hypothetical protein
MALGAANGTAAAASALACDTGSGCSEGKLNCTGAGAGGFKILLVAVVGDLDILGATILGTEGSGGGAGSATLEAERSTLRRLDLDFSALLGAGMTSSAVSLRKKLCICEYNRIDKITQKTSESEKANTCQFSEVILQHTVVPGYLSQSHSPTGVCYEKTTMPAKYEEATKC